MNDMDDTSFFTFLELTSQSHELNWRCWMRWIFRRTFSIICLLDCLLFSLAFFVWQVWNVIQSQWGFKQMADNQLHPQTKLFLIRWKINRLFFSCTHILFNLFVFCLFRNDDDGGKICWRLRSAELLLKQLYCVWLSTPHSKQHQRKWLHSRVSQFVGSEKSRWMCWGPP